MGGRAYPGPQAALRRKPAPLSWPAAPATISGCRLDLWQQRCFDLDSLHLWEMVGVRGGVGRSAWARCVHACTTRCSDPLTKRPPARLPAPCRPSPAPARGGMQTGLKGRRGHTETGAGHGARLVCTQCRQQPAAPACLQAVRAHEARQGHPSSGSQLL